MKRKIWPPKAAAIAKQMWAAGDSVRAITRVIGISSDTVLGKARREDWPGPPRPPPVWSPDAIEAARGMWAAGDSASIIAKALGISRNAVLGKAWREAWPHPVKTTNSLSRWAPDVIDTAKRMWVAGDSASAIAKTIGISRSTVRSKAERERWPRLRRAT